MAAGFFQGVRWCCSSLERKHESEGQGEDGELSRVGAAVSPAASAHTATEAESSPVTARRIMR
jgi:hypothetical protein